jgi:molybdopterin molybdotransferase
MISVENAIRIVKDNTTQAHNFESKIVSEALGYVLYKDVISPINMPPFRQSAMDGYALYLHALFA